MSSPYRQDAARQMRIAEVYAQLQDRLAGLPPLALALLPDGQREHLTRLRAEAETLHAAAIDEVDRREQVVEQLDTLSREVVERSRRALELPPVEPPAPSADPVPYLYEEMHMVALRRALEHLREALDPAARPVRLGDHVYGATLTVAGAPLSIRVVQFQRNAAGNPIPAGSMMLVPSLAEVWTNVPLGVDKLRIAPQRVYHSIGKVLRVTTEVEVGDPVFDGAFLLQCPPHLAARVFTAEVRQSLFYASGFQEITAEGGRLQLQLRDHAVQLLPVHQDLVVLNYARQLTNAANALVALRATLLPEW